MAKYYQLPFISVNGTDLSDHLASLTIDNGAEELDVTGSTVAGFREFIKGLKDVSINATFWQDYGSGSVDSVLQAMFSTAVAGTVVVKPTLATVSATNPTYTLVCNLFTYGPVSGAAGDAAQVEATFRHSGTAGLVRATA